MADIVIYVSRSHDSDGSEAYSGQGPLWDVDYCGMQIVKRSPMPFCDAARFLNADGFSLYDRLIMRNAGSDENRLIGTIKDAVRLAVYDSKNGMPKFRRWHSGMGTIAASG
jgi:hypothetical protein